MLDNNSRNLSAPDSGRKDAVSRKITQLVNDLPLFPIDIDQLLTSAVKPSEDGAELFRLIVSDSKLRDDLLPLARSYFGATGNFETVEDAVRNIGAYILGGICSLPTEQRQMHALAGLVHDVGRLAIMLAGDKNDGRVLGTLWDRMVSVIHEERAELGMDHCDVGARICRKWNFSPVMQDAVLRHHSPIMNGDFSFAGALIFLSHFVSTSDPSGEILATLLSTKVLGRLDLTAVDFEKAKVQYESRRRNSGG